MTKSDEDVLASFHVALDASAAQPAGSLHVV
jgi:hypothetical protein